MFRRKFGSTCLAVRGVGSMPRSDHELYSILLTLLNQGSVCKSALSTNAQSRFALAVVTPDDALDSAPCSSGSNTRTLLRALEGRYVNSNSPFRVRDGDKGVAGRNGRE